MCQHDTIHHRMAQRVNMHLDDEFAEMIKAQKPKSLSLAAFCALLIEQGLTASATLVERRGDTPGRVDPLSEASSSKAVTSKTSNKSLSMSLARHESEIREFWKVKKGSKGDTAWKLLMTELTKLQERYGDAVVEEQLQLAINGKWAGIRLSNYEQYKPKDAPKPKAKKLTPEDEKAKAERDHMERCRKWGLL